MNYNDYLKQQIQAKYGYVSPQDFAQNYKTKNILGMILLASVVLAFVISQFLFVAIAIGLFMLFTNDLRLFKHGVTKHPRKEGAVVDKSELADFLSANLSQFGLGNFQLIEKKTFGKVVEGYVFFRMTNGKFIYHVVVPVEHEIHKKEINWFRVAYDDESTSKMASLKGLRGRKAKINTQRMVPIIVETMNYYFEHVCTVK